MQTPHGQRPPGVPDTAGAPADSLASAADGFAGWLVEVGGDVLALVDVPRELWLGFALLLPVRLFVGAVWSDGTRTAHVGRALWGSAVDTSKVAALLYVATVLGNMLPVFGWVIVLAWGFAGVRTGGMIWDGLTEPGSELRAWGRGILDEVKRRILTGAANAPSWRDREADLDGTLAGDVDALAPLEDGEQAFDAEGAVSSDALDVGPDRDGTP